MYGVGSLLTLRNMEELTSRLTTAYHDKTPIPPTLCSSLFTVPLATLLSRSLTVRQQWLAHYNRLCTFSAAVMAPDEPLPCKRTLHSFFWQFPRVPDIDPPPDYFLVSFVLIPANNVETERFSANYWSLQQSINAREQRWFEQPLVNYIDTLN
jgi:hypothetical protein